MGWILLWASVASAGEYALASGIPLNVREFHGIPRVKEPVTFAVPLRKGDGVKKPSKLAVLDPSGKRIPSQFRVLSRWNAPPGDKSAPIRWLLVDVQVDVDANGEAVYTLTKKSKKLKKAKGKLNKVKVKDLKKKGRLRIKTGPARFFLSRDFPNFLDEVRVDLNGDGKVAEHEKLIDRPGDQGFFLLDRFGGEYASGAHDVTYTVEEKGPLRVVIRADGRHGQVGEDGIGRDFFQYRTRYVFYAGKPYVRVIHTLRNAYLLDPLGSIGFEGYRLRLELADDALAADPRARFATEDGSTLEFAGPSRLYQDSDGGPAWNQSPGTTFQGYRVFDGENLMHGGAQAPGVASLSDGERGVTLAMRWFFEHFPKGFEFADGKLDFHIFPAEFSTFHWLDDGQQITTDFLVYPHGAGGADPAVVDAFRNPLRPFPEPDWVRQTLAWGDQGHLAQPTKSSDALTSHGQSLLNQIYNEAFQKSSHAFGWSEFGEPIWAKSTHTTGSPRNLLTYFDRFAVNGSYWEFRYRELFAIHSRDIRPYHIDGFEKADFPDVLLWEGLPHSTSQNKLNRDNLDPALDPHREGIPSSGHGWNGFDFEHMVCDDLYEYYLLTGDPVSLDSLKEMGQALLTWKIYDPAKPPGSTRGIGWTLRALVKIHQVTGDKQFLDAASDLVTSLQNTYGKDPSPVNGLVYHYVTRFPPNGSHIADAEYDCPWQIAVTIYGLLLYHRETGEKRALDIASDIADYIVDYGWNGVAMNESMAVEDHTNFNYSSTNTGVNTWIPSALSLVFQKDPRPEFLSYATLMYDSLSNSFKDETAYLGAGLFHWWHSYRVTIGQ